MFRKIPTDGKKKHAQMSIGAWTRMSAPVWSSEQRQVVILATLRCLPHLSEEVDKRFSEQEVLLMLECRTLPIHS